MKIISGLLNYLKEQVMPRVAPELNRPIEDERFGVLVKCTHEKCLWAGRDRECLKKHNNRNKCKLCGRPVSPITLAEYDEIGRRNAQLKELKGGLSN